MRAVNSGLLCVVMSYSERLPIRTVWSERFRWASVHYVAHAPLAFAFALAYEELGLVGLAAFAVPPILATLSVRQYVGQGFEPVTCYDPAVAREAQVSLNPVQRFRPRDQVQVGVRVGGVRRR